MKRLKVALGACLAMLVAFTALAWAAMQYKTTIKVNGTKLNVQRYVEGKGRRCCSTRIIRLLCAGSSAS